MSSKNLMILIVAVGIVIVVLFAYFVLKGNNYTSTPSREPNVTSVPSVTAENTATVSGETQLKVIIKNFSFDPSIIKVKPGAMVTWINNDNVPHDIVSDPDGLAFKSQILKTGENFQFTFDQEGTFLYYCSIHPAMKGTVEVTP